MSRRTSGSRSCTTTSRDSALYDALNVYLRFIKRMVDSDWKVYKRFRPSDDELASLTSSAATVWTRLAKAISSLRAVLEGGPDTAGTFRRKEDGGDLWLRPIGTMILMDALVALRRQGTSEPTAVGRLAALPSTLQSLSWNRLLWDPTAHRMITRAENRRVAMALAVYQCGGDIGDLNFKKEKLEEEWSGLVGEQRRLSQLNQQSS